MSGMQVLLVSGETREIDEVRIRNDVGLIEVFNFTVGDHHNYFVGEEGILVHNGGPELFDDFN